MSRNLPDFPDLEHLRKQAKALLRRMREDKPSSRLAEAQHALAQEYGFASWPKLKDHVETLSEGAGGGENVGPSAAAPSADGGPLFPRFTEGARRTIFFARYLALQGNRQIGPDHLLLGVMLADPDLMNHLGLPAPEAGDSDRLKAFLSERRFPGLPQRLESPGTTVPAEAPLSSESRRVLEQAALEADSLRHARIGAGHFLLAFLSEQVLPSMPVFVELLKEKGSRVEVVRRKVAGYLRQEPSA